MKRLNKKGFTLAELLIVIAIIAILIAIAIPAFSASLNSAKLQTDHANIRSAYAMYRTAEMLGTLENVDLSTVSADTPYYFQKDGTLDSTDANAYTLQVAASGDDCASSVGCKGQTHAVGSKICITVKVDGSTGAKSFEWSLAA